MIDNYIYHKKKLNLISNRFINLKCKFVFCPLCMVLIEFYALFTFVLYSYKKSTMLLLYFRTCYHGNIIAKS